METKQNNQSSKITLSKKIHKLGKLKKYWRQVLPAEKISDITVFTNYREINLLNAAYKIKNKIEERHRS